MIVRCSMKKKVSRFVSRFSGHFAKNGTKGRKKSFEGSVRDNPPLRGGLSLVYVPFCVPSRFVPSRVPVPVGTTRSALTGRRASHRGISSQRLREPMGTDGNRRNLWTKTQYEEITMSRPAKNQIQRLHEFITVRKSITSREVMDHMGISGSTAGTYLNHLAKTGAI